MVRSLFRVDTIPTYCTSLASHAPRVFGSDVMPHLPISCPDIHPSRYQRFHRHLRGARSFEFVPACWVQPFRADILVAKDMEDRVAALHLLTMPGKSKVVRQRSRFPVLYIGGQTLWRAQF